MTDNVPTYKTNMANIQNSNYFIVLVATIGVAAGMVASLVFSGVTASPQVGANNAPRTVAMKNVSATDCSSPAGAVAGASTNAGGAVLGESVTAPSGGGSGGGGGEGPGSFVKTIVIGGLTANTHVSMSNTGPDSTNIVHTVNKNTTTITNNNSVNVSNSNSQSADTGDANVSGNTNAGSAHTGDAENTNTTETSIKIDNL
jgi:hypothetical protein